MPYTIQLTDGSIFATVADGTVDTTSDSITLVGQNKAAYGQILNQNVIRLLENSAYTSAPTAPLIGQLWYDTANEQLKVWDGVDFKAVAATATAAAPTSPVVGDTWYDTVNNQLNVYNGTDFILVGGEEAPATVETIDDNAAGTHTITKFYVDGTVVSIASVDATFTVDPGEPLVTDFPTLSPGINMSASAQFIGDATNALSLGGQVAANYLRSDTADTTAGALGILNDAGLTVGAGSDAELNISGSDVVLNNINTGGDVLLQTNNGSTVLTIDGTTSRAQVSAPLAGNDIVNYTYLHGTALTSATVKTLYEGNANTNEYDDAEQSKLLGIEAGAEVNPTDAEIKNAYDSNLFHMPPLNTAAVDFLYSTMFWGANTNLSLTLGDNRAIGRRTEAIIENTSSSSAITITLNAGWTHHGEPSPITVPAGKTLFLALNCTDSATVNIQCRAFLQSN